MYGPLYNMDLRIFKKKKNDEVRRLYCDRLDIFRFFGSKSLERTGNELRAKERLADKNTIGNTEE